MPAEQNVPARKATLADEVEKLLMRLRRDYLSALHSQPLPPIEPEALAVTWRKDVTTAIANQQPLPFLPFQSKQLFPSHADLNALDEAVVQLAKAIGIVRFRYEYRLPMFRRIEHDYKRLKLVGFARELARRVAAVPEPPLTKLAKILAGQLTDGDREAISDLYVALGGHPRPLGASYRAPPPNGKIAWEGFKPWLVRLTSTSFNKAVPTQGALMPACYAQIAFRDVLCQQQFWRACYSKAIDPTAQWLHGLLDDDSDAQLRVTLHGLALKPEEMHDGFRTLATRARSRAYRQRRKSGANPPRNS